MTSTPREPGFDRLPPVGAAMSRGEWAATGGVWAFLALSSSTSAAESARQQGADVSMVAWAIGALAVAALWAAVAPWTFRALDVLPVRAGVRARNLVLRVIVLLAANGVVGTVARLGLQLLVPALGLDVRLLTVRELSWGAALLGPFDGVLALLIAHVVLQRVHRSRNRQRQAAELETSLARARLDALAKEVQPHFLFNTLNGIAALVRDDPRTAEAMLVKLGDMLRITVDSVNDGEIPLGEELARLQLYIDLQRMRFGVRLTVDICAEPAALDALVPAMLLQPLVENALVHGLAGRPGPGAVHVGARLRDGVLHLTVVDDGIGPPARVRESTGLGNSRTRLRGLHGERARLTLAPRPDGTGTLVTVELPYRTALPARDAPHAMSLA